VVIAGHCLPLSPLKSNYGAYSAKRVTIDRNLSKIKTNPLNLRVKPVSSFEMEVGLRSLTHITSADLADSKQPNNNSPPGPLSPGKLVLKADSAERGSKTEVYAFCRFSA
jgi:hypothetical protein